MQPQIGFGIIGAGMIAEFHVAALRQLTGVQLLAVYARDSAKAAEFAARHGCTAYNDLAAFLAHSGLQAVSICTPSGAHLEPALAAMAVGKHVICEKPLEITPERVDAMIAGAQRHGVLLSGIFQRRFNPSTAALKDAIINKRFGRIALAEASIKWWRTQDYYQANAWRGTWKLDGGGALMNQGIHTVDLLLHLMGPVRRVSASVGLIAHHGIEVEDTAVAILEFVNGAKGIIQASTACYSATGHPAEINICGENGSVFMADDKFRHWEFRSPTDDDQIIRQRFGVAYAQKGAGAVDPKAIDAAWHARNFADFLQAIRGEGTLSVDGQAGRAAVVLIDAIYRAARTGGAVELR
jgi:UDP-N-acetyl-2-amino-2-deoxyglucuronate dehydrogenase